MVARTASTTARTIPIQVLQAEAAIVPLNSTVCRNRVGAVGAALETVLETIRIVVETVSFLTKGVFTQNLHSSLHGFYKFPNSF